LYIKKVLTKEANCLNKKNVKKVVGEKNDV